MTDDDVLICPECNEYPQHGPDMLCTNCAAPLTKPKLRRVKGRRKTEQEDL